MRKRTVWRNVSIAAYGATIFVLAAPPAHGKSVALKMTALPIRYVEPVYRPPSEAQSLILPVTDGCSWNRCTFCEMYTDPQKRFRPRSEEEVLGNIRTCAEQMGAGVERIFLADGDALTLSTRRLVSVLEAIRKDLPSVRRVSSYCLPRNLRKKSVAELRELAELGLSLVYVGAESGDDEVLARVKKGETFETTREALFQAFDSGFNVSYAGSNWGGSNDVCDYIEKGSMTVGWNGNVSPCWPLMHTHTSYLHKKERRSRRHIIGNVRKRTLNDLWLDPGYVAYRQRVQSFAFPPCTFCGGCELSVSNEEDCISNEFPVCGGCMWAQGVVQCP